MELGSFNTLKEKIIRKKVKVAVVGLGYVGLPVALRFVEKGFSVYGIDLDKDRIRRIKKVDSYITDVSSQELKSALDTKRFCVSDDFKIISDAEAILICVPTPLRRRYLPDISYIKRAVTSIARHIKKTSLIVLESTTYPGTTEQVVCDLIEKSNLKHNQDFYLCFSPERIDPGNKNYPLYKIPKIVGGMTSQATELGVLLYKSIIDEVIAVSNLKVAEAAKLLENTFRLVNIALVDELAMMCHRMGIDIWEVISAAKTKPFGFMAFYPGPGVGGHCIPKDPLYLYWKAKQFGFESRFIKLASDIITFMPVYVTERVIALLKKKNRKIEKQKNRVLIVGVTYKKDVKDLRKSPALDIIENFQKKGVDVSYYDPLIPYLKINHINLRSIKLNKNKLSRFDCIVIVTDHSHIDYNFILNNAKLIFDTRNVYKDIKDKKIVKL